MAAEKFAPMVSAENCLFLVVALLTNYSYLAQQKVTNDLVLKVNETGSGRLVGRSRLLVSGLCTWQGIFCPLVELAVRHE
jgi:hypothetical protein